MAKPGKKTTQTSAKSRAPKVTGDSLERIYESLSGLLARHAPPFKLCEVGVRNKQSVQLVVPKPVVISGAYGGKPTNVMLAAAILQKGFVGFYLMCIYMKPEMKKKLSPALLKLLKGKSCFQVKKLDAGLTNDIASAVESGRRDYEGRGWV